MKNRIESIALKKRNKKMFVLKKEGYPQDYIAAYFNMTEGRVSQILKLLKKGRKVIR